MPDLMYAPAVKDLRHWSGTLDGDPQFYPRLRLIRIFNPKSDLGQKLSESERIHVVQEGANAVAKPLIAADKSALAMQVDA